MVDLRISLPEGFLQEETRCGYSISHDMKKVWAVELDLLAELLRVCKKYGIKIFASGGTLLGAVRHKGFIPWDDDIDMMMFREDYDRLCGVAETEFRHPYFFQTEYTDPGSLRGHAQLRNSETTGILSSELDFKYAFNQGIFIDIFPLDSVVDDGEIFEGQFKEVSGHRKKAFRYSRFSTRYSGGLSDGFVKNVLRKWIYFLFGRIIKEKELSAYNRFELACQMYNDTNTEMVSTLSFIFNESRFFKYREDFEKIIQVPFEFMEIPIGTGYDHALRQRYGDYMRFEKTGSCHGGVVFDTETCYKDYLDKAD